MKQEHVFARRMCYNCAFAEILVFYENPNENELSVYCKKELTKERTHVANFCKDYIPMKKEKNRYFNFAGEKHSEGVCEEINKMEERFKKRDKEG